MLRCGWLIVALLASVSCRAPAPTGAPAALPPCPRPEAGTPFPLYPGAVLDPALSGYGVGPAGRRHRLLVYRVARPLRHLLAFYEKCLGRKDTRESEDGSYHFEQGGQVLTLSGAPEGTYVRLSRKPTR